MIFNFKEAKATYIILTITVAMFVVQLVYGDPTNYYSLIELGANHGHGIRSGEVWRLITPLFLHIGVAHLLVNMATLSQIGPVVERVLGSGRFIVLYLLSGIMGNVFSFVMEPGIVSAGASTALFGLFAFFVALKRIPVDRDRYSSLGQQAELIIIVNILLNLFMTGVDIWGHLGGVVGGYLGAYVISSYVKPHHRFVAIGLYLLIAYYLVFLR